MRKIFGALAVILGVISITITARYGYKLADTEIDGWIGAVMFGSISLCAFLFDAAAVRLWFTGFRKASLFVGLIAACALIVTFGNSFGGIVSRGDKTIAERVKVADARVDNRRELQRLEQALRDIATYKATDAAAVDAAKRAADTAKSNREAECSKRGNNCRARELDEQNAANALKVATEDKATTDRANKIEAEITTVRQRLTEGEAVQNPNPLGTALETMLGATAASLTAWQSAIVAAVFELCLVGVMVIFEILGHTRQPHPKESRQPSRKIVESKPTDIIEPTPVIEPTSEPTPTPSAKIIPPRPRPRLVSDQPPAGDVNNYIVARVELAPKHRIEFVEAYCDYEAWCSEQKLRPLDVEQFAEALKRVCEAADVRIQRKGNTAYLIGVRLSQSMQDDAEALEAMA
jgi:hypothetical protein